VSDKPKRRQYQFSIRTLLAITGAMAIALGVTVNWPRFVACTILSISLLLIPIAPFFLLWATGLFQNQPKP